MGSEHNMQSGERRFPTDAAMVSDRIVKLDNAGNLQYAGAADANAIGATLGNVDAAATIDKGPIVRLKSHGVVDVDISGAAPAVGAIAYQAANGQIASAGTVRAGLVVRVHPSGTKAVVAHGA